MTAPILLPLRRVGLWRRGEIEIALRSDGAWLTRGTGGGAAGDWILVATRLGAALRGIDEAGVVERLLAAGYAQVEDRACPT